ncbi:hypothetical protein OVY29_05270 [Sphingopyxis sp. SE2]|uniref:hypothetical protein n=1 Tax=Sphingopyxis sp. SE2 TaxID=1586240 RepID=UPI0028BFAFD5|nr:hypothetical protein [Sphingopyxis sp. SE2]MDT7528069.1 hypothetical protein [Sphingopyxis sp. SE2]
MLFNLLPTVTLKKAGGALYFFPAAFTPGCTPEASVSPRRATINSWARASSRHRASLPIASPNFSSSVAVKFAVAADLGAKGRGGNMIHRCGAPSGRCCRTDILCVIAPQWDDSCLATLTAKPQAHAWRADDGGGKGGNMP